ncbi:hypothetical protein EVAR_47662_1 [Eumeta japonica]|uniref:Uncharacterized protein n=1 Tax=Eumeta variegata TaxID=151549 RepID=A0A4C1XYH0_EUMVA|nr:hypothetical protein EVAR_47662_1 [Eumeta japonica]
MRASERHASLPLGHGFKGVQAQLFGDVPYYTSEERRTTGVSKQINAGYIRMCAVIPRRQRLRGSPKSDKNNISPLQYMTRLAGRHPPGYAERRS